MSDDDFKYLTEESGSKNLELLKPKDDYPYEYMNSFKRFDEEKLPDWNFFYSSVEQLVILVRNLDGHISDEDYLTCKKIWNVFGMHEKYGWLSFLFMMIIILKKMFYY